MSLEPTDPLTFKDRRAYADRLRESQAATGLRDGVVTGLCRVDGLDLALAVMDSASWVDRWDPWWGEDHTPRGGGHRGSCRC
ncbi:MAG: hypothetical protein CM15mP77_1670 [Synechococcus sp.]|nr:MAG: hypothetical protein CM15mP77_1670 [Synechococcus sp.]